MGVLDDAIREHIELKRKHGAREEELLVQEQEALGPARRESSAPPAVADEHGSATTAGVTGAERPADVEGLGEAEGLDELESLGEAESLDEAEGLDELESLGEAESLDEAEGLDELESLGEADDLTEAAAPDPPWGRPLDVVADLPDETRFVSAEEEDVPEAEELPANGPADPLAEDDLLVEGEPLVDEEDGELLDEEDDGPPDEEDEDVLEETPEFLQETPEHDRLWFEQKPPRDFDFDE